MPTKRKNRQGRPISAPEKPQKKKDDQVVKVKKQGLFSFKAANGKWYRLTPKQKLFCDYFLQSLNGVQSAFKVYKAKNYNSAAVIASENLIKPNITAYLTIQFAKFEITPDETMAHLSYLARQSGNLQAKARGIDMSLKVFGKYAAEKIEHGVDQRMREFLDRVVKRFPK